jgi:hypothetical protein
VSAVVTIDNMSADSLEGTLWGDVLDEGSGTSVLESPVSVDVGVGSGERVEVELSTPLLEPDLWHFDHPSLYRWSAVLSNEEGEVLHEDEVVFGVRLVELKDARFYLNGEPMRLVGLTRHADSPWFGLAETMAMMTRDWNDLKRLNQVFSRPVHYPQHEAILEYADRNGVLLIPEVPAWQLTARQLADGEMRALEEQQLREMIDAAFNHPSVWAWSIGNEFASDTVEGSAFARDMIAYVKSLDSTRPVGFASNRLGAYPQFDATLYSDFVMMNQYFGTWAAEKGGLGKALDDIHAAWPDKVVIISEFGFEPRWNTLWGPPASTLNLDEYYFIEEDVAPDSDEADEQRRMVIRDQMAVFRSRPFVAGAVFWTYQDYRTPSGFLMGVVDARRSRRGSWEVLREEYSPVLFEDVSISSAADTSQSAVVTLQTRGPLDEDMPAYTLWDYVLDWSVTSVDGAYAYADGSVALPVLEPGEEWLGEVSWQALGGDYVLRLRVIRPTGFVAVETVYDAQGELVVAGDDG